MSIVQNRAGGQSFQSIGGSLVECDLVTGTIHGAVAPEQAAPQDQPHPHRILKHESAARPAPKAPRDDLAKPGAIVKAARARIREIKRELKRHAALKQEQEELERLVAAAKTKPAPKVRALRTG